MFQSSISNAPCFDASSEKRQVVSTKIQHLLLWKPLQEDAFVWLSKTITCLQSCAALWYIVLFPIVLLGCPTTLHLSDLYSPAHFSHIFLSSCSLLKPGDLFPTSVSPWSFKQIAKEKFNMPLRDNYQTVKLPHRSCWVITFPPSLFFFFSFKWNHQFLKPWQSTIPWCCSRSGFWMKTLKSKSCPLFCRFVIFLSEHFLFFCLVVSHTSFFLVLTFTQTAAQAICILGNYIQFVNRRWTLVELDFANRRNDI